MNRTRPKNLNLLTIRFPVPAIASILHRLSGAFLFLMIPLLLWGLSLSLNADGYERFQGWASMPLVKLFFWLFFAAYSYHLVAGIRHLLMDVHIGSTLKGGRLGAQLAIIIAIFLTILAGIWLW